MGTVLIPSKFYHYMIDHLFSETPLMEQAPYLNRRQSTSIPLGAVHHSLRQGLLIDRSKDIGNHSVGQTIGNSLRL
jgi:hypothetical protein